MSEARWTKEQLLAITEGGSNLLVAAAAGAGKTAVLVERIIRKVMDENNPIDIDRVLVVTFTNAAATEMRERIGEAITKALDQNPEQKRLQRQLMLLNTSNIMTMHAFCLQVIKNFFHGSDIDPNFRIADETEAILMKQEALEDLFEEMYEPERMHPNFLQLVDAYSNSRDDEALMELVSTLHAFIQSFPWPLRWLSRKVEDFNIGEHMNFGDTLWAQIILESVKIELQGLESMMNKALSILAYGEGLQNYHAHFKQETESIEGLACLCNGSWEELYTAFGELSFDKLARSTKDMDLEKLEQAKLLRDQVKKRFKKINDDYFASKPCDIMQDLHKMYPMMKCLEELVIGFDERYCAKKKEKNLLDFNDLEHYCLEILTQRDETENITPSEPAKSYKKRFEEILVDEYQDSNLVQEVIINAISRRDCGESNIFMVGDVKQSIYRFRQANPELFLDKYKNYASASEAEKKDRKILLYKNFRSRQEVIEGVNYLFRQVMSENVGDIEYNEKEELNHGAVFQENDEQDVIVGGAIELHILDKNSGEEKNGFERKELVDEENEDDFLLESEEEPDAIVKEARIVASRILKLVKPEVNQERFQVFDKGLNMYRDTEYKDIVILLRTTKNWAETFATELMEQGIPAYTDVGSGFFKTIEVQIALSLLQLIDNPMQDIPLISVLRSPIAAFLPEELIDIRLVHKEAPLYEAMRKMESEENKKTYEKVQTFLENLERWRSKALYMATDELLSYLYDDTGYYAFVGALPGGKQRQANLRMLLEKAKQYEETSYTGLFHFILFINRLKQSRGDFGSAKILGENENVVRIMSIHKSKGLEFPIVFISGCGKKINLQDMNKRILLHQGLGFGPDYIDSVKRYAYPTLPKQALRCKIKQESLSEEMRILYVAMTRAKEKLIITGASKDIVKDAVKWCASVEGNHPKVPDYEVMQGKSYLDWIGTALSRHHDADLFRNYAGVNIDKDRLHKDAHWEIRVWNTQEMTMERGKVLQQEQKFIKELENYDIENAASQYKDEIDRRLTWAYEFQKASSLPVKMTVTQMKKRFHDVFEEEPSPEMRTLIKRPAFLSDTTQLSGAEKGTALHFVMQHLSLQKVSTEEEIKDQINSMVKKELILQHHVDFVEIQKILRFFSSALGKRMCSAQKIYREVPFSMQIRSRDMYPELAERVYDAETILLQGVIDCYFEESGGLVLLDYKTDYVEREDTESIKSKYKVQVETYAKALEKITGVKVKEKVIYLFWNGEILSF